MRIGVILQSIAVAFLAFAPTDAAEMPKNCVIGGRVTLSSGEPLPQVEVRLHLRERSPDALRPLKTTTSDPTGAYLFEGLAAESYCVLVDLRSLAAGFREVYLLSDEPQQLHADIAVSDDTQIVVSIKDADGRPVEGARVRGLEIAGLNGRGYVGFATGEWFGAQPDPSGADGLITLPRVPAGANLKGIVEHDELAPAEFTVRKAAAESKVEVRLQPGTVLTIRVLPTSTGERLSDFQIDLRHDRFENPSTNIGKTIPLDASGLARMAVEPGKYSFLWLKHPKFYLVPQYGDSERLPIAPGTNDELEFEAHAKVKIRGRVIEGTTGLPVKDAYVDGSIPNGVASLRDQRPAAEWAYAMYATTDENGEYELDLAAGRARLSVILEGYMTEQDHLEIDVVPDGSTRAPDIKVTRLPTIRGRVLSPSGEPAPGAIVRLRGHFRATQPTKTDDRGQFEIKVPYLPADYETEERQPIQPLVAFAPNAPLAAGVQVDVTRPETLADVVLQLATSPPSELVTGFGEVHTGWSLGEYPEGERERLESISLRGQPAPELDGVAWLNTERPQLSLADFRGKYVLLDFWTTWCGPCHSDFPSVNLLREAYPEEVVVIGVHDNSVPVESIRQHVEKEKLTFPIVVDHPDGRILSAYEAHGLSGYPSYALIGPDGTVLDEDDTTPGPTLRMYKIEIIRELLLNVRR